MKITVRQLREIIKEEVKNVRRRNLRESFSPEDVQRVADYLESDAHGDNFPIDFTTEELKNTLRVNIDNKCMPCFMDDVKKELESRGVYGIDVYPDSVKIYDR